MLRRCGRTSHTVWSWRLRVAQEPIDGKVPAPAERTTVERASASTVEMETIPAEINHRPRRGGAELPWAEARPNALVHCRRRAPTEAPPSALKHRHRVDAHVNHIHRSRRRTWNVATIPRTNAWQAEPTSGA